MNQSTGTPREFTGRHMLMIMISFFGVIIAVNFTMAWLAGHSWTGLVVKNSYVASQQYNDNLRLAQEQRNRGWQTKLSYERGAFSFQLLDRAGKPVEIEKLVLSVGRPATESQDRVLLLQKAEPGHYIARHKLDPGLWAVVIAGARGSEQFRYERRINVGAAQ